MFVSFWAWLYLLGVGMIGVGGSCIFFGCVKAMEFAHWVL